MKIFSPNTSNFTNTGFYPSALLMPGTNVYLQSVDLNAEYSNGDIVVLPIGCIENKTISDWYIECELSLEFKDYVVQDAFLVVNTKEKGEQPFRVSNVEVRNTIQCKAYHVGFDTKLYSVELAYALNQTCEQAMTSIIQNTVPGNVFSVYSDIPELSVFSAENMQMYDALVACAELYNGVLEFNKFQIRIVSSIGSDKGLNLEYGVNILESEVYEDWSNVVTQLKPIGNDGLVLNPEWLISDVSYNKPYTKIVHFNSNNLEDLLFASTMYLERWKVPQVNYKVRAHVNEDIEIGDLVKVKARQFELDATVLSYKYNVLSKSVKEIEFGNYRRTTQSTLDKLKTDTVKVVQQAIDQSGYIKSLADDEVVTVGEGGDFSNLNDALFYLAFKYPRFKDASYPYLVSSAEILLLSGYVMNEQVIIERMNLGFITITSEDAEVVINRSALTVSLPSKDFADEYPAFAVSENAVLPVIGCLFTMNTAGDATRRHGIFVSKNSSVQVRVGCGVKNCASNGLYVISGSQANAEGSIFTGCGRNGITANDGSRINCQYADVKNAVSSGVIAIDCSFINAQGIIATGCVFGVVAQYSSLISARTADISSCSNYGAYAMNNSHIEARDTYASGAGLFSYKVLYGSTINFTSGSSDGVANTLTPNGIYYS